MGFLDHISLNLGEGELSCELVYGFYSAAPVGDSEIRSESSDTAQQLSPQQTMNIVEPPGEERRVRGGVVPQLDEEQHCEQGEGQNLGDNSGGRFL